MPRSRTGNGDLNVSRSGQSQSSLYSASTTRLLGNEYQLAVLIVLARATHVQVRLSANTVDEFGSATIDLLDEVDDSVELRVDAVQTMEWRMSAITYVNEQWLRTCSR